MNTQPKHANAVTLFSIFTFLFLIGTENFLISPVLPSIATSLKVSVSVAAHTVSTYMVVYAICVPFFGALSDRFGRQKFISMGSVLFFLGNISASFADSLTALLLARALTSIGAAMAGPSLWAFIGDTTHHSIRGKVMGWTMAAFSLGQIMGVPIGAYISGAVGWEWAFRTIGGVTLILCSILSIKIRLYPVQKAEQIDNLFRSIFRVFTDNKVRVMLLTTLFWAAASLGTYTYLGAILKSRYGFSTSILGYMAGLMGIGSAVGGLVAGKVVDFWHKKNRKEGILLGLWVILLGISILVLAHTHTIWVNLVCMTIWFFTIGSYTATQQTILTLIAPDLKARSISWNNSFMYIGIAIGVSVEGYITHNNQWDSIGYPAVGFCLLAVICSILLCRFNNDGAIEISNESNVESTH